MDNATIMEILWKLLFFFIHPLFWFSLIATILLGYVRVKRERKNFRVRILPGMTEFKQVFSESWIYALILSIIISGVGLVVHSSWLILFSIVSFICLLTFNYKIMSPIYFIALSVAALFSLQKWMPNFTFQEWTIPTVDLDAELLITIAIISGLLLIAEGLLIRKVDKSSVSPFLMHTNRGLRAAAFKVKRLWMLPIVFIVPGTLVESYVPYWPQFTLGEQSFTFILLPVVIGFSQVVRTKYADESMPKIGKSISILGLIVSAVAVGAIWVPLLSVSAIGLGLLVRIIIAIVVTVQEKRGAFKVAPSSSGVVIVGVLPGSPSDKMMLTIGETIRSVNGQPVQNEKELYDAIQVNAAHCRLQVLGRDGEVRLVQHVIYHHDHHRLGLLVVR